MHQRNDTQLQLPALRVLNLGGNRFEPLTAEKAAALANVFPALRVLVLSETALTWEETCRLDTLAPGLEELHVTRNGLAQLVTVPATFNRATGHVTADAATSFVGGVFRNLKTINISENQLSDWGQVYALSRLPALSWLLASDNGLTELWAEACAGSQPARDASSPPAGGAGGEAAAGSAAQADGSAAPFSRLEQANLTGNKLRELWSLDALDALPNLTNLRLTNSDILPEAALGPSEARQVIVARLPKLLMLNGSEVRSREREDAEKAYQRRVIESFLPTLGRPAGTTITDVFGAKSVPNAFMTMAAPAAGAGTSSSSGTANRPLAAGAAAGAGAGSGSGSAAHSTLTESVPAAFRKEPGAGVIRAAPVLDRTSSYVISSYPLLRVSSATTQPAPYVAALDPYGLGSGDAVAAGKLQRLHPRYFLVAAKYDLHAVAVKDAGASATIASSVVNVSGRMVFTRVELGCAKGAPSTAQQRRVRINTQSSLHLVATLPHRHCGCR